MRKISVWVTVLALILVGSATAAYYGYQKANDNGLYGNTNIITSQAVGMHSVRFIGWHEDDVSAAAIADNGLNFAFGLKLDNGDEYTNETQHVEIAFQNYAKTEMCLKITPKIVSAPISPTDPCKNIYFNFGQDGSTKDNTIGQIDAYSYAVKLHKFTPVIGESVDTANSSSRTFSLDNSPIIHGSLVVYIDGVVVDDSEYTVDEKDGYITFYTAPGAPDVIVDADGTTTDGTGLPGELDVAEGDDLELFELSDNIVVDNLTVPTKIWIDNGATANIYDAGEPVIFGTPVGGDNGFNIADPLTGDPLHWKFHDDNGDTIYDSGEDIIIEGDTPDAIYFEGQEITADYQWSGEKVRMYIDVGNRIIPGVYEFELEIELTKWEDLNTVNMDQPIN